MLKVKHIIPAYGFLVFNLFSASLQGNCTAFRANHHLPSQTAATKTTRRRSLTTMKASDQETGHLTKTCGLVKAGHPHDPDAPEHSFSRSWVVASLPCFSTFHIFYATEKEREKTFQPLVQLMAFSCVHWS